MSLESTTTCGPSYSGVISHLVLTHHALGDLVSLCGCVLLLSNQINFKALCNSCTEKPHWLCLFFLQRCNVCIFHQGIWVKLNYCVEAQINYRWATIAVISTNIQPHCMEKCSPLIHVNGITARVPTQRTTINETQHRLAVKPGDPPPHAAACNFLNAWLLSLNAQFFI